MTTNLVGSQSRSLPPGWKWLRVRELAEYHNGRAFKPHEWGQVGLPIVRIENLTNPQAPHNHYQGEVEEKHVIETGDLLLSWSASLDAYIWDRGPALLNQHIFKVCEDRTKVTRSFLYFLLRATMGRIRYQVHGATMQHITKPAFESILVPVPGDKEEQSAIAALLESQMAEVQRMRRAAERQLVAASNLRHSVVTQELMSVGDPAGRLADILMSPPRSGWSQAYGNAAAGVPFLTLSAILGFDYDGSQIKYTDKPVDENENYWAQEGDIFMSRSNTPELVGQAAIYDGSPADTFVRRQEYG